MATSISKSVARAFEVLECFRDARTPFSATELRKRLGHPHSSVVAVLKNLTEIEYLSYDRIKRTYFPTQKLQRLGTWVQTALMGASGFQDLADAICLSTNETTSLITRSFIFNHIFYVKRSEHPLAHHLPVGIGITLCNSVVGRVVLSQMDDTEVERIYKYSVHWTRSQHAEAMRPLEEIEKSINFVRKNGYLIGYDVWLKGIGAVAYSLKAPFDGFPLAVSVSGPTARIRTMEKSIRKSVERCLSLAASSNKGVKAG